MTTPRLAFDAAADDYDADPHHGVIADRLVDGLNPRRDPGLVVDVATGTGVAAFAALRGLRPGRVVAVDISPRMLDVARATAVEQDPDGRIEWRVGAAVPLGIDDGSADVVICASSLHFLGGAALPEWRRVLRPGGQVAFSIPMAADFHPSPQFRALLPDDLTVPADADAALAIARDSGFVAPRVELTPPVAPDRPRRAFLVWAQSPGRDAADR
ncbi:class I SAM-dependent methyltransferase [Pseudonocardia nigra]|uniref:class I SAM-dependent methyltransferase n=1 Tax=Pseudonocardia nigra TaxID=1921578 RepID=UPI001C5E412E|nr:class I SAM-dependent methyltransferase [Pseudonocardia nigra]